MELFCVGVIAGAVITLIMVGGYYVIFDKGESDKHRDSDSDNPVSDRDYRSVDRHYKEMALLEHAKELGVKLYG